LGYALSGVGNQELDVGDEELECCRDLALERVCKSKGKKSYKVGEGQFMKEALEPASRDTIEVIVLTEVSQ
jgi:hypothetical protein